MSNYDDRNTKKNIQTSTIPCCSDEYTKEFPDSTSNFIFEFEEPNNGAKIYVGDLLDVEKGIIAHQVNCRGRISGGVSEAIVKRYPKVEFDYYKYLAGSNPENKLGEIQLSPVSNKLSVANLFSRFELGDSHVTSKVYTNTELLVKCIKTTVSLTAPYHVYIPYGIGCGRGGGNWDDVYAEIKHLPINIIKLPESEAMSKTEVIYQLQKIINEVRVDVVKLNNELLEKKTKLSSAEVERNCALNIAKNYKHIHGDLCKDWLIDQMVRALCETEEVYNDWVADYEESSKHFWEIGSAPSDV